LITRLGEPWRPLQRNRRLPSGKCPVLLLIFAVSLVAQRDRPITFFNQDGNPVVSGGVESTILMNPVDGAQCDMWFHWFRVDNVNLYYSSARNSTCSDWSSPVSVLNYPGGLYYPYVFKDAGTYYLLIGHNDTGNLFMYSSPDGHAWTILNGGNPVLRHDNSFTSLRLLYNPAAVIVNGTIHLLIETENADDATPERAWMAYASTTLSVLNFNQNFSPVEQFAVNPDIHYIPERNAFLVIHGDVRTGNGNVRIRASYAPSLSADLTNPASWKLSANFVMAEEGIDLADPSVVDTGGPANGKQDQLLMSYNYNQANLWQAGNGMTFLGIYEAVTLNCGPFWRARGSFAGFTACVPVLQVECSQD
jgi:hypothetical protein